MAAAAAAAAAASGLPSFASHAGLGGGHPGSLGPPGNAAAVAAMAAGNPSAASLLALSSGSLAAAAAAAAAGVPPGMLGGGGPGGHLGGMGGGGGGGPPMGASSLPVNNSNGNASLMPLPSGTPNSTSSSSGLVGMNAGSQQLGSASLKEGGGMNLDRKLSGKWHPPLLFPFHFPLDTAYSDISFRFISPHR